MLDLVTEKVEGNVITVSEETKAFPGSQKKKELVFV